MKKMLTLAMTAIFALGFQGPGRAQNEVAPPPISPLLEGQRPLEHVESKEPTAPPREAEQKKSSSKGKVKAKVKGKAKSIKDKGKAKINKVAAKKRQAVSKKGTKKPITKKRPVITRQQAGPDEG